MVSRGCVEVFGGDFGGVHGGVLDMIFEGHSFWTRVSQGTHSEHVV